MNTNVSIKFQMNESLYNRDPQDTELGKNIVKNSIILLDEIGFESFTFKRLANEIGSTEKSIYRYFENKHLLLLFLTSWYWEWVHYLINFDIKNIDNPNEKLRIAIETIVNSRSENTLNEYINETILHRVIINEGSKSYHTYAVDDENKSGLFLSYKSLVKTIVTILLEVNPSFPYPHSLASNLFEMANSQIYFAQHLPKMTSLTNKKSNEEELIEMLNYFVTKLLAKD